MISDDRFPDTVADWLEAEAGGPAPDWLHQAAMATAVRTPQRPAVMVWLGNALAGGGTPEAVERRQRVLRLGLVVVGVLLALAVVAAIGARRPEPPPIRNGSILVGRTGLEARTEYLTMRADGSGERKVFQTNGDCGQCAFLSSDGQRIMIPETTGDRLTTAIIRADGSAKIVLLPFPDTTVNLGPGGWSADGNWIALSGWDDSVPGRRGIYVARSDGTELRQLTHSADGRGHDWPTFSPDGTRLLFIAQDAVGASAGGFDGDLFVVDLDGSGLRQLNPPGTKVHETSTLGRPMDWSTDGTQIVFAVIEGELDRGRSAMFVAPAAGDGSEAAVRRSDWATWDVSVEWSAAGNWILSGGIGSANESIVIAHPDGSGRRELWSATAPDPGCCGTFSPDATRILFQRGSVDQRDLWTMDLDGADLEQVTHTPSRYIWYGWAATP